MGGTMSNGADFGGATDQVDEENKRYSMSTSKKAKKEKQKQKRREKAEKKKAGRKSSTTVDKKTCCGYSHQRWKVYSCIWLFFLLVAIAGGLYVSSDFLGGMFVLIIGMVGFCCSAYCFKNAIRCSRD